LFVEVAVVAIEIDKNFIVWNIGGAARHFGLVHKYQYWFDSVR
jgi:hypothetical protein